MSGPRFVRAVRIDRDDIVRSLDCGHQQRLPLARVPKEWRTKKGDVDLRNVLRAPATCTVVACGEHEPTPRWA